MALKSIDQGLAARVLHMATTTAAFDTKAKALDKTGYNGVCLLLAHDGAAAAATFAVQVVHSDDGATWENAPAIDVVPSMYTDAAGVATCPAGVDNLKVGYVGIKQFVAVEVTPTGSTGVVSVIGILGEPNDFPTN